MSFTATVYRILIASPKDLVEERGIIPEVIHEWNASHADEMRTVLLPVKWETHSVPEMGGRPQEIVNRRIVDDCDILIGVFWTRLGTPTGAFDSGTLEEIEEFNRAGKPVLLYFSSREIDPDEVDLDQLKQLREARERFRQRGLVDQFASPYDLRVKLSRHLHQQVKRLAGTTPRIDPPTHQNQQQVESRPSHIAPRAEQPVRHDEERPAEPTENGKLYQDYWNELTRSMARPGSRFRPSRARATNYIRFPARGTGTKMHAFASVRNRYLGVELVLDRDQGDVFRALQAQRADLENDIGHELEWIEQRGSYRIIAKVNGYDPADRADWVRQHEWFAGMLKRYNRVLVARIRKGSVQHSHEDDPIFKLRLQQTYFNSGFFNVVVDYDRYVRKTDGPVRLRLGRQGPEIEGKINRQANTNGTARISGGRALRAWFQDNFEPLDIVVVDLSSEDVIVLDRAVGGFQTLQPPAEPPTELPPHLQ